MKASFFKSALLLSFGLLAGCGGGSGTEHEATPAAKTPPASQTPQVMKASADLAATQGNNVTGRVTFEEKDGRVHVTADINGLTAGKHGFHIHETGDCSAPDASSAGGHFNPTGVPHGAPDSAQHHAGDFGNVEADESGHATLDTTVSFITLSEGSNSVIGKAFVVHSGADDLSSQPSGASGERVACGVIRKM